MKGMIVSRLSGVLLGATSVLFVNLYSTAASGVSEWPAFWNVWLLALCTSQVALVVLWAGWARQSPTLRVLAVVVSMSLMGFATYEELSRRVRVSWYAFFVALAATIGIGQLLAHVAGLRLLHVREGARRLGEVSRRRMQYSLRHLFFLVTAVAMVLAVFRWVTNDEIALTLLLSSSFAFGTLVTAWATLGCHRFVERLVAAVACIIYCPVAGSLAVGVDSSFLGLSGPALILSEEAYRHAYTIAAASHIAIVGAILWFCRAHGYRLKRDAPARQPQPAHEGDTAERDAGL